MGNEEIKHAIEALLFASEKPLSPEQIQEAFEKDLGAQEIRRALETLRKEYIDGNRWFKLFEIAGGFQLVSDPRFASYLKRFYQAREK